MMMVVLTNVFSIIYTYCTRKASHGNSKVVILLLTLAGAVWSRVQNDEDGSRASD
jgi:hypothetical protein